MTVGSFGCGAAAGDELIVPDTARQARSIGAIYRFDHPVTGHGLLEAEWTDVLGRIVERRRIPLDLVNKSEVTVPLDRSRPLTVKNEITVRVSLDETDESGKTMHYEHESTASFIVTPPGRAWSDYQIIMWQRQTAAGYAALKRLGITGGMVSSDRLDKPGQRVIDQVGEMLDTGMRWYLENTATDFYSAYHKWSADRPVNWRFREAKQRYWANPQNVAAFVREPSLSDPAWLGMIRDRLIDNVRALRRYGPLFYSLADEPGIADLSAFWDFDFSPTSLAAMREWLKTRYSDLAHLNEEWGSAFRSWDEVVPMTTTAAMKRADQNFAAWGDFKEWMDVAFTRALKSGSDAVHAADPEALAAIEGAQIPGWGGYDYSRLATSVDAMEVEAEGDIDELLRSFNPNAVMLTISFRSGAAEAHRVWRELLRGTRGLILWDHGNEFVNKDGSLGERGRGAAPYFHEIRDGLGALLINSRRHEDPIGILYSPASMRIEWLLDRIRTGEDWSRRSASTEWEDDRIRVSMRNYARAIEHMGLQHRFVSAEQVENGDLARVGYRVLILPRTIALSPRATEEIRKFVKDGGTVIADGEPGIFDEHGRRLKTAAFADVFAGLAVGAGTRSAFGRGEAINLPAPQPRDRDGCNRLRDIFSAAGIVPMVSLIRSDGRSTDDLETYIFKNAGITIVGLLRDLDKTDATRPNPPDDLETVELKLPRPYEVYDVRAQRALGYTARRKVAIGFHAPVVLVLSQQPLPEPSISGPTSVNAGDTARFRISPNGDPVATLDVFHIEITDPDGNVVPYYGRTLLAPERAALYTLPLAINDKAGVWTLRARDLLTGGAVTAHLQVEP
ncbi:MAG: beta-galactosidase [Stellaceae bacterium]